MKRSASLRERVVPILAVLFLDLAILSAVALYGATKIGLVVW